MVALNREQQRAVETTEGRVLVLAGAGSGKTRVIVHRIAHLLDKGVSPTAILGLTFTNKAAEEMRHRLEGLVGVKEAKRVTLSTFHSFCMRVLRSDIHHLGYTPSFSLYDERDMRRVVQHLAKEMVGVKQGDLPSLGTTLKKLSEIDHEEESEDPSWHDLFTGELHKKLQASLRAYNAVSFDTLISLTIELFENHPAVLAAYQDRFRYLLIDEYQDTNRAQFRLAELLAKRDRNLCVVGDDDQSIYGWRGADVSNILKFEADATIKLEQNYRSSPTILEAANQVIAHNKNRHEKKLWSQIPSSRPIEVFNALTDAEEASAVIKRVLSLKEEGFRFKEIAILYRSNSIARIFEAALIQAAWQKEGQWVRGIPYEVFGGLEFSERSEIKDLLAYLRVIANRKDQEALLRIINVPRRGISEDFLDELTQINRKEGIVLSELLEQVAKGERSFPHHPRGLAGIRQLIAFFDKMRDRFANEPLGETLMSLLEEVNYKRAIEEEVKSEKMRQFKWENVLECVNAISSYEKEAENPSLADFIATTTLARQPLSRVKKSSEDRVQLMTLHSAKGLEFRAVFLVGLEDHILPHEKSIMETGIEEERRLFYVGITRAKELLTLSMARARLRLGKPAPTQPSRFLFEIPSELLQPVKP
jgi:superfamily I DNA/RNA helicase